MCKGSYYIGGWPKNCPRKAVRDDLCAHHAAGAKRSKAVNDKRQDEYDRRNAERIALESFAQFAGDVLSTTIVPSVSPYTRHANGDFTVTRGFLQALIDKAQALAATKGEKA